MNPHTDTPARATSACLNVPPRSRQQAAADLRALIPTATDETTRRWLREAAEIVESER